MSSDSLNYDELPFSEEDRPPQSAKRECSNHTEGEGSPTNPTAHRHATMGTMLHEAHPVHRGLHALRAGLSRLGEITQNNLYMMTL